MSWCGYGTDEEGVVIRVDPLIFEKYFVRAGVLRKDTVRGSLEP